MMLLSVTHARTRPSGRVRSGIVMAATPSVSQLHGAERAGDAGAVVRQALWVAVCGSAAVAALLQNVDPAYRLLGVDERAVPALPG